MKRLALLALLNILLSNISKANPIAFTIQGKAQKVIAATSKSHFPIQGTLSNGDKIEISLLQNTISVNTIHAGKTKEIAHQQYDENVEVSIYEYDFDKDNVNEIIVEHGNDPIGFGKILEIFRYAGGLSERVGFLIAGQGSCTVENNTIHFPHVHVGGDDGSTYLYKNGGFYELVYQNPDQAEKAYFKNLR